MRGLFCGFLGAVLSCQAGAIVFEDFLVEREGPLHFLVEFQNKMKSSDNKKFGQLVIEGLNSIGTTTEEFVEIILEHPELERAIGDFVGNGGGIVEVRFANVFLHLAEYIQDTLLSPLFNLNQQERDDLQRILVAIRASDRSQGKLKFISRSKYPSLFDTKDSVGPRIAVTGNNILSPIIIDADSLYTQGEKLNVPAIEIGEMVNILVHEMGHQAGIEDHTYLDGLGALVKANFEMAKIFVDDLRLESGHLLGASAINLSSGLGFSTLEILASEATIDLSRQIRSQIRCGGQGYPSGLQFQNLHWGREKNTSHASEVTFSGWITLSCLDDANRNHWEEEKDFVVTLNVEKNGVVSFKDLAIVGY